MNDIIELSKEEIAYGEGYVEGLKDAKAERDAAIAAAVAEAVAAKDALIVELYDAWKDAPLKIAQRSDRADAMTKAAAAIRNGSASK